MAPPITAHSFAGAVLTGGRSRRMGRDKALVEVAGRPLAAIVADALVEAGADPVVAIGGNGPALRAIGLHPVPDRHVGEGPLGGIITALAEARSGVVVVLACDLPRATADGVRAVVDTLVATPAAAVAVPVADGRRQPLHAAWRSDALPVLEAAFAAGERAVRLVLDDLATVELAGLDPAWFANVNAEGDLPPD